MLSFRSDNSCSQSGHKPIVSEPETKNKIIFVIFLPKLFLPTVGKNCSSDQGKLLKFEAEAENLQNF